MVKGLGKGLLARFTAFGVLLLGFWTLYQGFLGSKIHLVLVGGVLILVGMWLLVFARKGPSTVDTDSPANTKEENPGDSLD